MSEKLLELSSVVNVISRTVGDIEQQRQNNETRALVHNALLMALYSSLSPEQRLQASRAFDSAAEALLQTSTRASREALRKEINDIQRMLN